jgi:hypothetical protein
MDAYDLRCVLALEADLRDLLLAKLAHGRIWKGSEIQSPGLLGGAAVILPGMRIGRRAGNRRR